MSDTNQNQEEMDNIKEYGQTVLNNGNTDHQIHLLNIIGEIEGHECLPSTTKTTKYEHVLPKLASIEDDDSVDGVMLLLNTVGGDVESGLAIAEMIAPVNKLTAIFDFKVFSSNIKSETIHIIHTAILYVIIHLFTFIISPHCSFKILHIIKIYMHYKGID